MTTKDIKAQASRIENELIQLRHKMIDDILAQETRKHISVMSFLIDSNPVSSLAQKKIAEAEKWLKALKWNAGKE